MTKSAILTFLSFGLLASMIVIQYAEANARMSLVNTYGIVGAKTEEFGVGKHILPWGNYNPTSEQIEFVASRFDIVNVQIGANKDALLRIKQLNPDIILLLYLDAVASAYISESELYESDFLHDVYGNRLKSKSYGFEVRDPGSQHWRELWAEKALSLCQEYKVDGIFADDAWTILWEGNFVGSPTIEQAVKDAWYGNMRDFLSYVKQQLGNYLLIPNTPDNGAFVDVCDGKWEENFVHARWASYGSFPSVSKWKRKIDGVQTVCENEKIALVSGGCSELERSSSWTQAHQDEVQELLEFSFCSYLLGVSGDKSAFNFGTWWNRDGSRGYYSIFDDAEQLGSPVSGYDEFGPVYARDFENGKVLVNPATSIYTVNLGDDYKTLDGQTVSTATLGPHTGLMLLE